jgi:2-dehydro-3-deoxygluconokinase
MRRLMPYICILIANEEDAEKVLGIQAEGADIKAGVLERDGYVDVARKIYDTYGTASVGITLRKSFSASDNQWSGLLYTSGQAYFSKEYSVHIVDRVGGGDSFAAGLLYAMQNKMKAQETIEFAAAASCLKQTMEFDVNLSTVSEVTKLAAGDGSGRVQR